MVSKFLHTKFDVEIIRKVSRKRLYFPSPDEVRSRSRLENMSYDDFSGRSWTEAREYLEMEREFVGRIESAADPELEADEINDELYEDLDGGLWGLDLGIASTVVALSAAKCIPVSSCNGGAFGSGHREDHPLVVFYAKSRSVDLLLMCACRADIGLIKQRGLLMAYADCIPNMMAFAGTMIESSAEFDSLNKPG